MVERPGMERNDERAPAADPPPVHGVTLEGHAEISAEIAEGSRPLRAILQDRGLTEVQWTEASITWMRRLGDDALANRENARLALVYSDAFSRAQDALARPPAMTAAEYAGLVVAIQRHGSTDKPLLERRLSNADYLRISRHFARVLSTDPTQASAYFEAYTKLHEHPT